MNWVSTSLLIIKNKTHNSNSRTWNLLNHETRGPCRWYSKSGLSGCIPAKRACISSRQLFGASKGPTTAPASGRPNRYDTSWRVGAISPHGKWKVWVSGLHRSTKQQSSDLSGLMRRDASTSTSISGAPSWSGGICSHCRRVASTRRAIGKRPDQDKLQQNFVEHNYSSVTYHKLFVISYNITK